MKFRLFFLLIADLLLAFSESGLKACGPYAPIIPTPQYFKLEYVKTMADYEREENIRLWQEMTSKEIPLSDIEQAVYRDSREQVFEIMEYPLKKTDNKLYAYLKKISDTELLEFLLNAKEIEEARKVTASPWYYPRERGGGDMTGDFSETIERLNLYDGERLKDRYGLQIVRALFASHQYERCIEYYDSVFMDFSDANLMKRMAQRYVAGCWSRLGDTVRADSMFAKAGDIWSVSNSNRVECMVRYNPNALQLIDYIRNIKADQQGLKEMMPVAEKMLKDKRVIHKGDWAYLLAYYYREFCHDQKKASHYISRALKQSFSSEELHDMVYAYKMKQDACEGKKGNLAADLKWAEKTLDIPMIQNILYADWIPRLWKERDYTTAIMLASYADGLASSQMMHEAVSKDDGNYYLRYLKPAHNIRLEEIRKSDVYINPVDYTSLAFQMMGSLTSSELAKVAVSMNAPTPLYNFLRKSIRTDKDYYNELTGTLALREENYQRAIDYLSKVSDSYLESMNINKGGYLSRDPFKPYPSRWTERSYPDGFTIRWESQAGKHKHEYAGNRKLDFARKMLAYQKEMRHGATSDRRGLARLMYALGRRNALEECWALTQYWRGSWVGLFEPQLIYSYDDDFPEKNYGFLYDYPSTVGYKKTEEFFGKEVKSAMAMLHTDEARAEAEYILGNVATVIKRYGSTRAAAQIRTSCDNWRSWL